MALSGCWVTKSNWRHNISVSVGVELGMDLQARNRQIGGCLHGEIISYNNSFIYDKDYKKNNENLPFRNFGTDVRSDPMWSW